MGRGSLGGRQAGRIDTLCKWGIWKQVFEVMRREADLTWMLLSQALIRGWIRD